MITSGATRRRRIALASVVLGALLAVLAVGCGGGDEAEDPSDEIEEKTGVESVDIDPDTGDVIVGDGQDGLVVTTNGELPEGFPGAVPLPEQEYVISAATKTGGVEGVEGTSYVVTLDVGATPDDVEEGLAAAFDGAGWTRSGAPEGGSQTSLLYADPEWLVTLSITPAEGDASRSTVSYTVIPAPTS